MIDQLLFSFSNVILLLMSARQLTASDFGAFALVFTAGLVIVGVTRGLTSETLVVRFAGPDVDAWRWGVGASGGVALVCGLCGASVVAVVGAVVGGMPGASLLALAAALPGVITQDFYRYAALAAGRPLAAIGNDLVQVTVQVAVMAVLIAHDHNQPSGFLAAWGLGSYVAAFVAGAVLVCAPRPGLARRWFGQHGDLASRYGLDNLIMMGSQNAGSFTLGLMVSVDAVGAIRGTQMLFTPPSVVSAGVRSAVTPEIVRGTRQSKSRLRRDVWLIAIGLGLMSLVCGIVVLAIPDAWGIQLLGPTWFNVEPLLPWFAFAQVINGVWIGPMVGLRALGAGNRVLVARGLADALVVGGQILGAVVGGALGVAVATALVRPAQLMIWWYHYSRAARGHSLTSEQSAATGEPA